ncbi:MAG: DUF5106 domain-containing protein [Phocaeicola sp.]
MSRICNFLILTVGLFLTLSCSKNSKKQPDTIINEKPTFTLPQIPPMITDPESRANFLAMHYWDNFLFTDTTYIHLPDVTEQAIVNFMDILLSIPSQTAQEALQSLLTKATVEPLMGNYIWDVIRRYWNDPNSPMRNEKMHLLACKAVQAIPTTDERVQIQAKDDFIQLSKNQVGKPATDVLYAQPNGKKRTLYSIKSDYTLLFFYDPGCETCENMKKYINHSDILSKLIDNKKLQIVAFFPSKGSDEWKARLGNIPSQWINACDPEELIYGKQLYYLQAIPTLYLLDKEKIVRLKDVTIEEVEAFFKNKSL